MTLNDALEDLLQRSRNTIPQKRRRNRLTLYTKGLKSKFIQVDISIENMKSLYPQTEETPTSTESSLRTLSTQVRIEFYNDCFWTFLYSVLDIAAQIVNQSLDLGIDEGNVSFKRVCNHMEQHLPQHQATQFMLRLVKSRAFSNTLKYRNCSNHRRPIFIHHRTTSVMVTAAYSTSSAPILTTRRIICDDPLQINPRTRQNRELLDYCTKTREAIEQCLINVVNTLP